jgi:hypothetical protein
MRPSRSTSIGRLYPGGRLAPGGARTASCIDRRPQVNHFDGYAITHEMERSIDMEQFEVDKVTASDHENQDLIQSKLVHVHFVRFVEVNWAGKELHDDHPAPLGYLAFNGDCREFGHCSFQGSDDYTIESDVVDRIQEHHPNLYRSMLEMRGYYLGGTWYALDHGQIIN